MITRKKKKYKKLKKAAAKKALRKEIINSILGIVFLVALISFLGFKVLSGGFEEDEINVLTAGYLTFNYTESNTNVISLVSAMPISDEEGIKSNQKEDYFEFEISNSSKESVKYEIMLEPLINNFNGKFLKLYLTDENNEALKRFDKTIPTWNEFNASNTLGSAIIYDGYLGANETKDFRLRVWISEDYVVSDKADSFSFRINIRDINE